jgi:hypothetical protein
VYVSAILWARKYHSQRTGAASAISRPSGIGVRYLVKLTM